MINKNKFEVWLGNNKLLYKSTHKEDSNMSKKNKTSKKDILKMFCGRKTLKIVKKGKIKMKTDTTINIDSYIKASINDAKISRLDAIPSKEEIVINEADIPKMETTVNCTSIVKTIELMSAIDTTDVQTILIPMTKKKSLNLDDNGIIGWLSNTSTFGAVFAELKDKWDDLNDGDKTTFTNVMFIPNIYVFLGKGSAIREKPIKINLMLVAIPTRNNATDTIEVIEPEEYIKKIISDSVDSCIKCGCKNIVIDPFDMKQMRDDVHFTSNAWKNGYITTQKVNENIKNITFTINDDDLYVIFCKSGK